MVALIFTFLSVIALAIILLIVGAFIGLAMVLKLAIWLLPIGVAILIVKIAIGKEGE